MNTKQRKGRGPILAAILALFGGMGCSRLQALVPQDPAQQTSVSRVGPTSFICKSYGSSWGSFAHIPGKTSINPMIAWNTMHFGYDYTPEKRCQIVSNKLTNAVANNGGRLKKLDLKTGEVTVNNGQYVVVCAATAAQPKCNLNNMLFTLKPENAENPNKVLVQMLNFTLGKASDSMVNEGTLPSFVSLERLVDNVFARGAIEEGLTRDNIESLPADDDTW